MVNIELATILEIYEKKIEGQVFNIKKEKNTFFKIIETQPEKYSEFLALIKSDYEKFKKLNDERIIKKTFTTFLYNNFQNYLGKFIKEFFGLDDGSLDLKLKEKISDSLLIIEYNYNLSDKELNLFEDITTKLVGNLYGKLFCTGYFFYIIEVLGIIIRKIIKEKLLISIDCAIIKNMEDKDSLNFLILVRESKEEIFESYLDMTLFYFLKQIKGVPDEFFDKLLIGREKLYEIASKEYYTIREKLIDNLYYFYKKCKHLGNLCPILDLLNFVCSRVEDSVFNKLDVVKKDFLSNFNYSAEKKSSIVKIFDFFDKSSTLYSTFQANNLPTPKSQFNLFLLYMKFYLMSGLEALEVGNILFLPEVFTDVLNEYNLNDENHPIGSNSIKNIALFTNYFSILTNISQSDLFFKKIFKKDLHQINYKFFRTFLNSFNIKIALLIEEQNTILSENKENKLITFNILTEHICRILYVLIDKIFLRETPDHASKNFIDPRGRYIGRNIALRVLELLIFQEINFSDDIWPEYLISLNKDKIKNELKEYVTIPEKNFYKDIELTKFLTIYNLQSFINEIPFEEWLLKEMITPLNNFLLEIKNAVKDPKNVIEVYDVLSNRMLSGIEDEKTIKNFKYVCQQLAHFWKEMD